MAAPPRLWLLTALDLRAAAQAQGAARVPAHITGVPRYRGQPARFMADYAQDAQLRYP